MPDGFLFTAADTDRRELLAWAQRPDPYRDGWIACMQWEEFDPPSSLSPADAEAWRAGWQDAYDAPLGSACP